MRELRAGLWLKDDGVFGDGGWGGNKVRKLEWLLARRSADGRKRILTFGGRGTNWGLATALLRRARTDIDTVLALVDQPMTEHVVEQFERIRRSGARVVLTDGQEAHGRARCRGCGCATAGRGSCPRAGSTPLGAVGYVEAGLEIGAQVRAGALPEPDRVVARGRHRRDGGRARRRAAGGGAAQPRPYGVVVNDKLRLDADRIAVLAQRCARLLRKHGAELGVLDLGEDAFELTRDYLGDGYGHPLAGLRPRLRPRLHGESDGRGARSSTGTTLFLQTDGPR